MAISLIDTKGRGWHIHAFSEWKANGNPVKDWKGLKPLIEAIGELQQAIGFSGQPLPSLRQVFLYAVLSLFFDLTGVNLFLLV